MPTWSDCAFVLPQKWVLVAAKQPVRGPIRKLKSHGASTPPSRNKKSLGHRETVAEAAKQNL